MNARSRLSEVILFFVTCGVLMSGCASSKGSISSISVPSDVAKLASYNELVIHVAVKDGATEQPKLIGEEAAERIKNHIINGIKKDAPVRFREINPGMPGAHALLSKVLITNYDEGNAFARFMLAGLGQMHIDADVSLSDPAATEPLAKYEVTKTFAWGGLYGASKTLIDIEEGFAKAVVEAILRKLQ